MAGMNCQLKGLDKMLQGLEKKAEALENVQEAVRKNGADLQSNAMRLAPVDTGTLQRSIRLNLEDGGMTARVRPTADYAAYVEYGTRYMKAQPYMRPSYDAQKEKFKSDVAKAIRDAK